MRLWPVPLISLAFFLQISTYLKSTVILPPLPNVWLLHYKTTPSIKWTVSVFSSMVELNRIKHGCSKKGYNNIFHVFVRSERLKSWVIFRQNAILLYSSILFRENLTFPRLPFHFLSDWPPNPNPKKEKIRKVSPYVISSFLCTLS